jgi:hypothetical protein
VQAGGWSWSDAAVPGFVEALYLVGSAAMGDFRPPLSDVDFVVVKSTSLRGGRKSPMAAEPTRYKASTNPGTAASTKPR